ADLVAELLDELLSARGPFWLSAEERRKLLPTEVRTQLVAQAASWRCSGRSPRRRSPKRSPCRKGARRARATRASRTPRSFCEATTRTPARPCRGAFRES